MAGVFAGLQVLDLSWGTAGPMTTMFLADNGADVTRIEPPDGDPFRDQTGYRVWHRGKRSARLDLRSAEGHRAFLALVGTADLVVDSFSPGTTADLGIDHQSLSQLNPRLITCSITGYGEHPEHRDRPGYDGLVAARTGLLYDQKGRRGSAMEYIGGRPGPHPEFDGPDGLVRGADRPGPVFPRTPWPSVGATYFATLGIAAALRAREVTGEGQRVTTSLLQGALAAASLNWQRVENPDAPLYWMWPIDSRSIEGIYQCADGRWVHHWTVRPRWVLASAEHDELGTVELDAAYRDDPDRISMEADGLLTGIFLHPLLTEAFKKFPSAEWVKAGEAAGMGVAIVRSPGEALADPSFLADGCVVEVDDPEVGRIRHAGPLLEFSATPGAVSGPAPRSGQHTAEVRAAAREAEAAPAATSRRQPDATLDHPLQGIRVLDLGLGVAGPYTGRVMADLGADVIKVNALHDTYWAGTHMGLGTNRGKRSIALNLKHKGGREALEKLIETADVVATNWRPGAAARLGIDYETLRQRYPGLIYCNTRGYEKGPRSELPGTDQTAAALSGTEWEDGASDAGNPPLWSRSNMGDTGNALLAAIAIVGALYHRQKTGEGQEVSTSIVNAGLLHTSYAWIHADGTPAEWGHVDGDQYGLSPYYRLYQGSDQQWLFLAAVSPGERAKLNSVISDLDAVVGDSEKEAALLMSELGSRPAADWFTRLDEVGVPVELVDEAFCRTIFDDPEAKASQLITETWSGSVGRFEDPGLLVNVWPATGVIQRGPSMCGEHTREILREIGYSDEEVDGLAADKGILDAAREPS
ncbi:MAG TPA: CoA transferase [Acidimicrobiales bacterium]|jgi:crotonobetainyl-CoA:carnitine CoA-transferase CaiB-like acyl-CoA transferase|nr:CoA transferase [Acidimicrobiales bacterium]